MQLQNLNDLIEFDAEKKVRKRLFMTDKIEMELVCYAPGQSTVEHHHVGQDEIFMIIDGSGTISVGGEPVTVGPGSLVFGPADIKHSIQPDRDGRMVMVFVKAPGRSARPRRAAGAEAAPATA
jgi:quercetin dioxygenase-like cupin family protein